MSLTLAIAPHIVEAIYREALALSDDVRATFALSGQLESGTSGSSGKDRRITDQERARIAYSSAGLRTTTRMMHAIAWLLNHRAYFMGEISEAQLRRQGQLDAHLLSGETRDEDLLAEEIVRMVERTRAFYERLLRLDDTWQLSQDKDAPASAIQRLRQRIESRLAS